MYKIGFAFLLASMLFIVNGCESASPKITEKEAEAIIIENHTGEKGEVEVVSITHKRGKYIVVWENNANCESGIDHISDQNGEQIKGEHTIC